MNIKADVAVIGAGTGGASAAYHLAKAGVDTALFEGDDGFGAALNGVNGIFVLESRFTREYHMHNSGREIFDYLMIHANYSVDQRQITEMIRRSSPIYNWLESMGADTVRSIAYNINSPHTWHYFDESKPRCDLVGKAFLDEGGKLYGNAVIDEIVMENGRVAGLKGHGAGDDAPITVTCRAVVIATGEPRPYGQEDVPFMMMPGAKFVKKTNGIEMALKAGGVRQPDMRSAMLALAKPEGYPMGPDSPAPVEGYIRQPRELAVNLSGERFANEEVLGAMEDGACSVAIQKDGAAFIILDDSINEFYINNGWEHSKFRFPGDGPAYADLQGKLQEYINVGLDTIYIADSIRQLAEKTGLDPDRLEKTVNEYNDACASGNDIYFFKNQNYLTPLNGPRYYALKVEASFQASPGPLKANYRGEVLTEESDVIPGLYGVGGAVSTLNGSIYTHYCAGSRSTFGLTSGQIVGEVIPEYLNA